MPNTVTTNAEIKRHIDWGMVSIAVALLVQSATIVWWASGIDRRVGELEQKVIPVAAQSEITARLDERTKSMQDALARIEARVDRTGTH